MSGESDPAAREAETQRRPSLTISERRNRLLCFLRDQAPDLGATVPYPRLGRAAPIRYSTRLEPHEAERLGRRLADIRLLELSLLAASSSKNVRELEFLLEDCAESGLVRWGEVLQITVAGHSHLEAIGCPYTGRQSEPVRVAADTEPATHSGRERSREENAKQLDGGIVIIALADDARDRHECLSMLRRMFQEYRMMALPWSHIRQMATDAGERYSLVYWSDLIIIDTNFREEGWQLDIDIIRARADGRTLRIRRTDETRKPKRQAHELWWSTIEDLRQKLRGRLEERMGTNAAKLGFRGAGHKDAPKE